MSEIQAADGESLGFGSSRPYRSHKVRACDMCRKNKSRCIVDSPGLACLLCRLRGANCLYLENLPSQSASSSTQPVRRVVEPVHNSPNKPSPTRSLKRRRENLGQFQGTALSALVGASSSTQVDNYNTTSESPGDPDSMEAEHILGPAGAHDALVLKQYMSPEVTSKPDSRHSPFGVYSNDPKRPVIYSTSHAQELKTIPKFQLSNRKVMDQIMGRYANDLIDMCVFLLNSALALYTLT
jgi:hypothetical protein